MAKRFLTRGLPLLLVAAVAVQVGVQAVAAKPDAKAARLERGRYIVEGLGMCIDCHSPRLPTGEYDRSRYLMGATLPFAPTVPLPAWAPAAPSIAGLENYTDAEAVRLFTTGMTPLESPLRPPMPEYRMSTEDAEAVVAYLRSVPVTR